jgi:CRP/FNR family transcriptional regulator
MGARKKHADTQPRPPVAKPSEGSTDAERQTFRAPRSRPSIARLAKHKSKEIVLAAGERLVSVGDPITSFYFLREGLLSASTGQARDKRRISAILWPGELVLPDPAARGWTEDLWASTAVRADVYDFLSLAQVLRDDPELAAWLFQAACGDLSRRLEFEHRLRVLAVEGRFAALLAEFAKYLGEPREAGRVFSLPLLRAEVASYLGLRTETICRVLARWQKSGLITLEGRRTFVIRSLAEFEAMALGAGQ